MQQERNGSSQTCGLFLSRTRLIPVKCAPMRLLELQTEADSRQACAAAGREVPDANLRGWAALIPEDALAEGLRQSGLAVLQGTGGALALGNIAQIWLAARSLADADRKSTRLNSSH